MCIFFSHNIGSFRLRRFELNTLQIVIFHFNHCIRPYHEDYTRSHPLSAVKLHWVLLVLGRGTTWEYDDVERNLFILRLSATTSTTTDSGSGCGCGSGSGSGSGSGGSVKKKNLK